jgi:GDP-L-fucose synthase
MKHNSKIYVAGHLGLVGSALWKNLQSKGYSNLIGRTIDELDLMDAKSVNTFFENVQPEYVILAAAKVGGIVANSTYRGQFIYENLMIQNNVIHAAYLNKVKKLLFLGSTCIYPRDAPQPMPEDCLLTGLLEYTNEPYAIAKIAGLKMCESYNIQYGTNFISVMPTNLYGPNDNFNLETSHVLPAMIRKIHLAKCLQNNDWEKIREDLNKRPVEGVNGLADNATILKVLNKFGIRQESKDSCTLALWGSGKPLREFLWSEEMADACVFLLENRDFEDLKAHCGDEIKNTHINIGTGKEISIKALSELIKKTIGFDGKIEFDPSKPDGTMRKLTDPSKLHALGWHHQIEIEEGIKKLYDWYLYHELTRI